MIIEVASGVVPLSSVISALAQGIVRRFMARYSTVQRVWSSRVAEVGFIACHRAWRKLYIISLLVLGKLATESVTFLPTPTLSLEDKALNYRQPAVSR